MKIDSKVLKKRIENGEDVISVISELENDAVGLQIFREVEMKENGIKVGDRILVELPGEKHFATAINDEGDSMLFLLDDYLDEARPMNKEWGTEGGYDESDLRWFLQKLQEKFPENLKERMVPFENGDLVSILSVQEMFGTDINDNEIGGQIEWMKDRKHSVAYRKNDYEWGWLRDVVSAARFAIVDTHGDCYYARASDSLGVRPAFKI